MNTSEEKCDVLYLWIHIRNLKLCQELRHFDKHLLSDYTYRESPLCLKMKEALESQAELCLLNNQLMD